jgi:hypothetical protein
MRGRSRSVGGAGRLEAEQLHAADAEVGQDRDAEHDEPHPAEPLRQAAPEQDARRCDGLDVGEHGRARGREAGHRLEERGGRGWSCVAGEEVGQRADERHGQPGERDRRERLRKLMSSGRAW